eukprot:TRINITY_DN8543_c0_g1_i2.p2 TRINITY_DN8543_c0_g1~~TRINITY_DN8543_c0_g1_i2.p2  ORF type:complete len:105 (-),score=14.53 TRINITY_DN8543_c0_g1_i2:144-458(-)
MDALRNPPKRTHQNQNQDKASANKTEGSTHENTTQDGNTGWCEKQGVKKNCRVLHICAASLSTVTIRLEKPVVCATFDSAACLHQTPPDRRRIHRYTIDEKTVN